VTEEDRKERGSKGLSPSTPGGDQWWSDSRDLESWLEPGGTHDFEVDHDYSISPVDGEDISGRTRLERIKESHALLRQFTFKELKILLNLKRNTSPKAWTLREDLVVLTLGLSNREIADLLHERNKEAVKKRLQLLKSKGLMKRQPEPAPSQTASPPG
jgi:hypothetical protein